MDKISKIRFFKILFQAFLRHKKVVARINSKLTVCYNSLEYETDMEIAKIFLHCINEF